MLVELGDQAGADSEPAFVKYGGIELIGAALNLHFQAHAFSLLEREDPFKLSTMRQ